MRQIELYLLGFGIYMKSIQLPPGRLCAMEVHHIVAKSPDRGGGQYC